MATVAGSITSVHLVGAGSDGVGKSLLLNCSFGQYTANDTAVITNAAVAIQNILKNGKTVSIKGGMAARNAAGLGSGGTAVFASAVTAVTSTISCNLGSTTTNDASTPASQGVGIYVTIEES